MMLRRCFRPDCINAQMPASYSNESLPPARDRRGDCSAAARYTGNENAGDWGHPAVRRDNVSTIDPRTRHPLYLHYCAFPCPYCCSGWRQQGARSRPAPMFRSKGSPFLPGKFPTSACLNSRVQSRADLCGIDANDYSSRKAVMGSTLLARRAGMNDASKATAISMAATEA